MAPPELFFIVAFGVSKALADFLAGDLADRISRKRGRSFSVGCLWFRCRR